MATHSAPRPAFRKNDKLVHKFNPDLGPGRVEEIAGRRIVVLFPKAGSKLTFAADDSALRPLVYLPGQQVRIEATGVETTVEERVEERYRLADGTLATGAELWPLSLPDDPLQRLGALENDRASAFRNRLSGLLLARTRQARGLGSFLGGRIRIYPHQLHVAERATAADPVRWLLADEVGLGKTIEACLILSRLLRTERADRTLVVAPATLTVQWLGELYRKFHQNFVLLDKKRREDVATDHGPGFNPFEAHRRSVIAMEDLEADRRLVKKAEEAGLDLLVIDEAHRLERLQGDSGNAAYRALAPLTRATRHLLLLSATPLEADTHGFFSLLELARPDAYRSESEFLASLERDEPLSPCTSATRRVDIGGLPPRVAQPVDLPVPLPIQGLAGDDDPRVEWLVAHGASFAKGGAEMGKTLVFCHDRGTLDVLKGSLETATRRRVAVFHEELSVDRRDLEVAEFRRPEGPTFLISTECGGEGRNFEFCKRLVLFDLPLDPAQVEQRIGRLDRINRTEPVEIVYFRPASGFGADLVALYEAIGLFREPLGGLERSLSHVEQAIRKAEKKARLGVPLPVEEIAAEVRAAAGARQKAVYHHLHADGYRSDKAEAVLSRIPESLDADLEAFTLGACDLFGFERHSRTGKRSWYIEFGSDAIVEHLPGVPGGTRWLGTFDREEAVEREEIEFFSSGHPLVEGVFQEMEDGPRGRVALVRLEKTGVSGDGLLFLRQAPDGFTATAIDLRGRPRPEWSELLLRERASLKGLSPDDWLAPLRPYGVTPRNWPTLCERLAARAPSEERLLAIAAFRLLK